MARDHSFSDCIHIMWRCLAIYNVVQVLAFSSAIDVCQLVWLEDCFLLPRLIFLSTSHPEHCRQCCLNSTTSHLQLELMSIFQIHIRKEFAVYRISTFIHLAHTVASWLRHLQFYHETARCLVSFDKASGSGICTVKVLAHFNMSNPSLRWELLCHFALEETGWTPGITQLLSSRAALYTSWRDSLSLHLSTLRVSSTLMKSACWVPMM